MFVGLPVGHGASVTVTPMRSFSAPCATLGHKHAGRRVSGARLYLGGAGCHGGPGITFIPGYNVGHQVLEDVGVSPQTSRTR